MALSWALFHSFVSDIGPSPSLDETHLHTADDTATRGIGVHVESLPGRRPEQSARRESFGMVSQWSKVQQRRRDKLLLEHFCFITVQVGVAASFQKGQFIIEVERRHKKRGQDSDIYDVEWYICCLIPLE